MPSMSKSIKPPQQESLFKHFKKITSDNKSPQIEIIKEYTEETVLQPQPYTPALTEETLNEQQQCVLEELEKGNNILITGPGGTGKTFLIHHIRKQLETSGKKVAITSLTGMAALLIGDGARTIHSWSGLGIGNRTVEDYYNFILVKQKKTREAWRETDVLIIDEISMMSDDFFEKLNALAQLLRRDKKPFGGIQLLCFGDFYQLPPINTKFVFESPLWNETLDSVVFLDKIYRQKDPIFQNMLNEIRAGTVSDETDTLLKTRLNIDFSQEEIQPTKIFTRRDMVDRVNTESLEKISGESKVYTLTTMGKVNSDSIRNALARMDSSSPYVERLELKIGAQVMLLTNLDIERGLVNGKLGIVKGFNEAHNYEAQITKNGKTQTVQKLAHESVEVLFKGHIHTTTISAHAWKLENNETISRNQIPLALAYAITIHKSQGATLDSAYIDIGPSVFEYGQAYVALSRVKSLDALYLHAYTRGAVRAHPKVVEYYKSLV